MNVTSKPLNQLAIMHKRVQHNRPIKDCAKLFRDQRFWLSVCKDLAYFDRDQFTIIHQLRAVLTTPLHLTQLSRKQSSLLTEACLFFIHAVFVAEAIFDQKKCHLKEQLDQLRKDWLDVNWVVTVTISEKYECELGRYLNGLIADQLFKSLLMQVLKKLQQEDYPRYQNLAKAVYFSRQLRFVQHPFVHHVLIDKNKLVLGFRSTKAQAKAIYERLTASLAAQCDCYFSHFSKPLRFKNYAVKRNWKLKKIMIDVPQHLCVQYAKMYQYGDFHNGHAKARGGLIHKSIPTIYSIYQNELNQVAAYFTYADNEHILARFVSFVWCSFVKTIALKQGWTFGQAVFHLNKKQLKHFKLLKRRN